MSELKQFLRFEISGYIVILYVFLFIMTFFDLNKIKNVFDKDILGLSISSFVVAAPLGYIMHQIDISINSPFKEKTCGVKRNAIEELKKCTKDNPIFTNIKTPQMPLEIFKCLLYSDEKKGNFNYFKNEISNRYSYYYSRMEAGIFSPIFGFIIFLIIAGVYYFNSGNYPFIIGVLSNPPFIEINLENKFKLLYIIFTVALAVSVIMVSMTIYGYCKNIIKEIDELECFLVHNYNERIINNL